MLDDRDEGEVRERGDLPTREHRDGPLAIRERDVTARIETARETARETGRETAREPHTEPQRSTESPEVTSEAAPTDEAIATRTAPARVADYLFIAIYSLLGVRLLIALAGVRADTGVARAIAAFTDPLYAPFRAVADPVDETGRMLALPVIIAMVAYMLVHAVIGMMLRMMLRADRRNTDAAAWRTNAH